MTVTTIERAIVLDRLYLVWDAAWRDYMAALHTPGERKACRRAQKARRAYDRLANSKRGLTTARRRQTPATTEGRA